MARKWTETEEAAGMEADFLVYYRLNGNLRKVPVWASSPDSAELECVHLLGTEITVCAVVKI